MKRTVKTICFLLSVCLLTAFCFFAGAAAAPKDDTVKVSVSFDTDGGSVFNPKTVTLGKPHGSLPMPSKEGFGFGGWFYFRDYEGGEVTPSSEVVYNGDYTLFAKWETELYTISFDLRGGQGRAPDKTAALGDKYTFAPKEIARDADEVFTGWEFADGTPVTADSRVEEGGCTLYAAYKPWVYLQRFDVSFSGTVQTTAAAGMSGITVQTQNKPNVTILNPDDKGLTSVNTAQYVKSGRSLRAQLYSQKPASISSDWRPYVKIPKTAFTAPYNTASFADMRFIEIDLYLDGNSNLTPCYLTLYSGNAKIQLDATMVCGSTAPIKDGENNVLYERNGWNTLRFDLSVLDAGQLAKADALALEFSNNATAADTVQGVAATPDGKNYRFWLDDLRAVMKDG